MKKIGYFKKEDDQFTGIISMFNLHADVRFVPVEGKDSVTAPDFRLIKNQDGPFVVELGTAHQRYTKVEFIPYLDVLIDDPSCPGPIHAVLWKGDDDNHYLYWHRTTNGEHAAEKLYVQEELKPPIGSARLPQKMTAFIQQLYPELVL